MTDEKMQLSVVFDMDGVLFDSERLYGRAWRQSGARWNLPGMEDTIRRCVGRNGADIRVLLQEKYGPDFDAGTFMQETVHIYQDIVEAEGLPLKPGTREILDWLRGLDSKIALATSSGKDGTAQNLRVAGLTPYFDAVVTGDMVSNGKPAPDIYLLACRLLGAAPADCFAVEDSPNGIRSAAAAGLKTILVPDVAEVPPGIDKLVFKTFDSLVGVLEFLQKEYTL